MQFEISTQNFKATGEITNGQVQYSVKPRSQTARMVCKLRNLKKDGLNGTGNLDIVAGTLKEYENFCLAIDGVRA